MSESNGLAIALVAERFEPGEDLLVDARWELETAPEAIEVRLTWYTSGRGTGDFGVERDERIEMPGPRGQRQLRFALPEGPYSFRGKFVAIAWAAEIVALPGEASARCDFALAPGGREVVVEEIAPEGLAARLARRR